MRERKRSEEEIINIDEEILDINDLDSKEAIEAHEDKIWGITEFFSVLSDPTRVKILLLLIEGEKCVGKLAEELGVDSSLISHQLKILRHLRLVKKKRKGKFMRYTLSDDHIIKALNVGLNHAINCMGL